MALSMRRSLRLGKKRDNRGVRDPDAAARKRRLNPASNRLLERRRLPGAPSARGGRATAHLSKTYHRLSRFYDRIFTPLLATRIHRTIAEMQIAPGSRVLDVGVGTGASLDAYPRSCEVVGIDLSEDMLTHAWEKIRRHQWDHIQLRQMDALNIDFPSHSFDYVMAFHIAAVVPDPLRLMCEITRVCKPGGTIAIINHLRSEDRWVGKLLDLINPVTNRLGWQTQLRYDDLVGAVPIQVRRRFKTSPNSLFTVIIGTRSEQPA
jgi:phosphatidylethanolamine/phosphatidyl-N-methylethanolamine N-methyltransferase